MTALQHRRLHIAAEARRLRAERILPRSLVVRFISLARARHGV